jgi:hypothetical protein
LLSDTGVGAPKKAVNLKDMCSGTSIRSKRYATR